MFSRKHGLGKPGSSKKGKESGGSEKESMSSVPKKQPMPAIVAMGEGGEVMLKMVQVPRPVPKANEVLVKVFFAGVNRSDVEESKNIKSDQIKELEKDGTKSEYMGLEFSGTVVAFGEGISKKDRQDFQREPHVCGVVFGGAYAEYVAVPVGHLLKFDTAKILLRQAAAIPLAACTVWSELFMKQRLSQGLGMYEKEGIRLPSGKTILIHGGCSCIGLFAIQIAKHQGAIVYATAGTDEKVDECKRLGADLCINYHNDDFVEVINAKTQGVDVILDCVGYKYFEKNIECLNQGGRLLQIGGCWMTQSDSFGEQSNLKYIDVASLVYRTPEMKTKIVKEVQEKVIPLIENHNVEIVLHETNFQLFKEAEAAKALKLKDSGKHIGKIVLMLKA